MKNLIFVFLLLGFLIPMACTTKKIEKEAEVNLTEQEMIAYFNSFNAEWRKAILDNDATNIIKRYDENAIIGPPNKDFIIGKKAITAHWNRTVNFLDDFSYVTQKIGGNFNDVIFENGIAFATYTIDNKQVTDTSKYLFVWKYIGDKKYKVLSEMFNE